VVLGLPQPAIGRDYLAGYAAQAHPLVTSAENGGWLNVTAVTGAALLTASVIVSGGGSSSAWLAAPGRGDQLRAVLDVVLEFTEQGRCRFVRRSFGRGVVAGGGWVSSPHLPTGVRGRVCVLAHHSAACPPATGGG
jgi:hypothetical protein